MKLYALNGDRMFEYLRTSEYQKKGGGSGQLAIWRGVCQSCGAAFEVSTPASTSAIVVSKAFGQVHCGLHKRTRKDVKGA